MAHTFVPKHNQLFSLKGPREFSENWEEFQCASSDHDRYPILLLRDSTQMISSPIGCGSRWLPRRAKPESSKPMFSSQSWTTAAQDKVNFVELGFNKQKTNYLPPNIPNRSENPKSLGCFQICLENSAALTEVVVFGREAEAHWCCRQFGGRSLLPSLPASLLWGRGASGRAGVQGVHIQVYQIYPFFLQKHRNVS